MTHYGKEYTSDWFPCRECDTYRPEKELETVRKEVEGGLVELSKVCRDKAWCERAKQAKKEKKP